MKHIVESIVNDPKFVPRQPHYVSVYESTQVYGGPEEGGWWVTQVILVGSIEFPTRQLAEQYLETATKEAEEATRNNRGQSWKRLPDSEASSMHPEGYIPRGFEDDSTQYAVIETVSGIQEKILTEDDLRYS